MCGVQTIVTNHWATKPENNFEMFERLLRASLTENIYLGASLKRHWDASTVEYDNLEDLDPQKRVLEARLAKLFRYNTITYGVPLVRVN